MPKKIKLKLKDLSVKSFTTAKEIKAGEGGKTAAWSNCQNCDTVLKEICP